MPQLEAPNPLGMQINYRDEQRGWTGTGVHDRSMINKINLMLSPSGGGEREIEREREREWADGSGCVE